jgi:hypothetical protein
MQAVTWPLIAAPLIGTVLNVALFIAMRRIHPSLNYLLALIIAFVVALVPTLVLTAMALRVPVLSGDGLGMMIFNGLAYGGMGYGWFTVVNPCATAVRIRILALALSSPDGSFTRADIREIYHAERMLDNRLGRLLAWRQLEPMGERYRAVPGAVFPKLHAGVMALKRLVFGKAYRGQ